MCKGEMIATKSTKGTKGEQCVGAIEGRRERQEARGKRQETRQERAALPPLQNRDMSHVGAMPPCSPKETTKDTDRLFNVSLFNNSWREGGMTGAV